jgi:hypothetical protein
MTPTIQVIESKKLIGISQSMSLVNNKNSHALANFYAQT